MISAIKDKIFSGEMAGKMTVLMLGTSLAQLIIVLVSPLITRIYSAEDFGVFSMIFAVTSVVAILSALRLDAAIVVSKFKYEARALLIASFVAISLSLAIFVLLLNITPSAMLEEVSFLFEVDKLYLILVVLLSAAMIVLSSKSLRNDRYRRLASARVFVAMLTAIVQVVLGVYGSGANGLLIGVIAGYASGVLILLVPFGESGLSNNRILLQPSIISRVVKKYSNFPKYELPATGLNSLSQNVPIILYGFLIGPEVGGYYALITRVLGLPITVIANSIGEVFRRASAEAFLQDGSCEVLCRKVLFSLFLLGLVPFSLLFFFGEEIFVFVFGENWKAAGSYASILSLLFFLRFMASPLSGILHVVSKQRLNLIGQFLIIVATITGIWGGTLVGGIEASILLHTLLSGFVYVLYVLVSYHLSKGKKI